jgi:hypothetical protein
MPGYCLQSLPTPSCCPLPPKRFLRGTRNPPDLTRDATFNLEECMVFGSSTVVGQDASFALDEVRPSGRLGANAVPFRGYSGPFVFPRDPGGIDIGFVGYVGEQKPFELWRNEPTRVQCMRYGVPRSCNAVVASRLLSRWLRGAGEDLSVDRHGVAMRRRFIPSRPSVVAFLARSDSFPEP